MDRNLLFWTFGLFFGASIAFGLIRDALEDESVAVSLGAQGVLLVVLVTAIVVISRRRTSGRDDDEGGDA